MYLHLGTCMVLKDFHLSRIENVNFDSTIAEFKSRVAEQINFLKDNIELAYCGTILKDSTTLRESGLQAGFVVSVLQKKERDIPIRPNPVAESDLQDLVRVFQILATRNAYRRVLQKLNKPEVLENIISTTPGLCDDDIALVILQHPELIAKLGDVNAVKKVIEEHPTLANAARNLVAAVQNDMLTSPSASTSTAHSPHNTAYMGASDDEEMESLSNSDSQNRTSEASEDGEHPVNVITSSQVAAALANTTAVVNRNSSTGASSSGITPEMMSAALQQAIASTSSQSSASTSTSTPAPTPTPEANSDNSITAAKLEKLRKLGFFDDAINIQALQLANGDMETAVNLLLNGFQEDM